MEKERRIKALAIVVLVIAVIGLSVAFAALSQTLTINGSAYLNATKWGIKFENLSSPIKVGDATVTGEAKINESTYVEIANMNVNLKTPGDSVTYNVDLVNEGTINAKIEKIEKTALTEEQAKYLSFKVIKEDGQELNEGYILGKETRIPLTIKIEFKKDITKEDLPKETSEITLSYKINFVQTDEKVASGGQGSSSCTTFEKKDKYSEGDVISVCNNDTGKSEDFYVIGDLGGEHVLTIAKDALLYGYNRYITFTDSGTEFSYELLDTSTPNYGLQDPTYFGATEEEYMEKIFIPLQESFAYCTDELGNSKNVGDEKCTHLFAGTGYVKFSDYETLIFEGASNSNTFGNKGFDSKQPNYSTMTEEPVNVYTYAKNYENYLKGLGKTSAIVQLLDISQLQMLGCTGTGTGFCPNGSPSFVNYGEHYWINYCSLYECAMFSSDELSNQKVNESLGLFRPVVSFKKSEL